MKIYILLLILFLVGVGVPFWLSRESSKTPIINNPQYTVGSIKRFESGPKTALSLAVVTFQVNGNEYENDISSTAYKGNVIDEKYKVKYEQTDPTKNIILTYEPVFLANEKTKFIKGTITRIYKFRWFRKDERPREAIEFEFKVDGKVITKAQNLPPNYKDKIPNLIEGNVYTVEYWEQNPKRSVIYFNKPL